MSLFWRYIAARTAANYVRFASKHRTFANQLTLFWQARLSQAIEQSLQIRFVHADETAADEADRKRRSELHGLSDGRLRLAFLPAFRQRAQRKPPENLDAWELMQRGLSKCYRVNKTDRAEAIRSGSRMGAF